MTRACFGGQPAVVFFEGWGFTVLRLVCQEAMVCLGNGVYRISGVPRMHERPQKARWVEKTNGCRPFLQIQELIEALRKLGYRVDTPNNKLPALFFGKGPVRGSVTVSVEEPPGHVFQIHRWYCTWWCQLEHHLC